jgi:nitrile hydratase accessory protein
LSGAEAPPAFAEPWQAQAFAMTVALHGRGLFAWSEWTEALGAALRCGGDYHEAWVAALEGLLAGKGVAEPAAVDALAEAWVRAAEATPHGQPIRLENDPLG